MDDTPDAAAGSSPETHASNSDIAHTRNEWHYYAELGANRHSANGRGIVGLECCLDLAEMVREKRPRGNSRLCRGGRGTPVVENPAVDESLVMMEKKEGKMEKTSSGSVNALHQQISRRDFLKKIACLGTGLVIGGSRGVFAESGGDLPRRVLGRTNARVSILGLGTAPVGEGPVGVQEGIRIFGEALDRGVTYVDTARIYGNAEEILGHLVPKRRDRLFVATKVSTETAAGAERSLSQSLRTMKIDHVDLVHIHSIGSKNIGRVLGKGGALEYLLKQKEKGKLRFIGISGHNGGGNFVRMLETDQIDVLMCVMNYADRHIYNFEERVLPTARRHKAGCVAMKVYAGIKGGFPNHRKAYVGCATAPRYLPQALSYALDLEGLSVAVVGPYTVQQARQNVEFAMDYKALSDEQRNSLIKYGTELAKKLGPRYGPA